MEKTNRQVPRRSRNLNLKLNRNMRKKLAVVFIIICLAFSALCGRLIYLTFAKGNDYTIQVLSQQSFSSRTIPYKRGDIQDCNGNVLATSIMVYDLVVDSQVIMSDEEKYFKPTNNFTACFSKLIKTT